LIEPGKATASRQAWRSTQAPSGTIRPLSSASGTNSAGATIPRVGCCQRNSASSPLMALLSRLTSG